MKPSIFRVCFRKCEMSEIYQNPTVVPGGGGGRSKGIWVGPKSNLNPILDFQDWRILSVLPTNSCLIDAKRNIAN